MPILDAGIGPVLCHLVNRTGLVTVAGTGPLKLRGAERCKDAGPMLADGTVPLKRDVSPQYWPGMPMFVGL